MSITSPPPRALNALDWPQHRAQVQCTAGTGTGLRTPGRALQLLMRKRRFALPERGAK